MRCHRDRVGRVYALTQAEHVGLGDVVAIMYHNAIRHIAIVHFDGDIINSCTLAPIHDIIDVCKHEIASIAETRLILGNMDHGNLGIVGDVRIEFLHQLWSR